MVPVVRVKSVEEAVDHCNANNLALQGCVFSRDIDQGELSGPWLHLLPLLMMMPMLSACALQQWRTACRLVHVAVLSEN